MIFSGLYPSRMRPTIQPRYSASPSLGDTSASFGAPARFSRPLAHPVRASHRQALLAEACECGARKDRKDATLTGRSVGPAGPIQREDLRFAAGEAPHLCDAQVRIDGEFV